MGGILLFYLFQIYIQHDRLSITIYSCIVLIKHLYALLHCHTPTYIFSETKCHFMPVSCLIYHNAYCMSYPLPHIECIKVEWNVVKFEERFAHVHRCSLNLCRWISPSRWEWWIIWSLATGFVSLTIYLKFYCRNPKTGQHVLCWSWALWRRLWS